METKQYTSTTLPFEVPGAVKMAGVWCSPMRAVHASAALRAQGSPIVRAGEGGSSLLSSLLNRFKKGTPSTPAETSPAVEEAAQKKRYPISFLLSHLPPFHLLHSPASFLHVPCSALSSLFTMLVWRFYAAVLLFFFFLSVSSVFSPRSTPFLY